MYTREVAVLTAILVFVAGYQKSRLPGVGQRSCAAPRPKTKGGSPPDAPLKTQLGNKATEIAFLGWFGRGERLAIRSCRAEVSCLPKHAGTGGQLRLFEVHDALTWRAVASFRQRFRGSDHHDPRWRTAHREAKPAKAWKDFVAANPLAKKAAPSRVSPDGRWSVVVRAARRYKGLELKPDKQGATYRWGIKHMNKPWLELLLKRASDGAEIKALRVQIPLPMSPELHLKTRFEGEIRPYWSPDGQRVLLMLSARNNNEDYFDQDARFYIRSLGPQVMLTGARKDAGAALEAARSLGRVKLPVARLTLDRKRRSKTLIYYRGAHRAAAEAAAKAIGGPHKIEQLKSKGWVHVIVLLKSSR